MIEVNNRAAKPGDGPSKVNRHPEAHIIKIVVFCVELILSFLRFGASAGFRILMVGRCWQTRMDKQLPLHLVMNGFSVSRSAMLYLRMPPGQVLV